MKIVFFYSVLLSCKSKPLLKLIDVLSIKWPLLISIQEIQELMFLSQPLTTFWHLIQFPYPTSEGLFVNGGFKLSVIFAFHASLTKLSYANAKEKSRRTTGVIVMVLTKVLSFS